ncbi:transcription factor DYSFUNCTIONAL TAPETUM 1 [Trifolium pratense]|uniref:Transcription factor DYSFUNCTIONAL TAPETUM 1 n=1 Tax=Trifolium pratense TaxID=57577 RepID=A0A2K3PQQ7_TRIPR|nr:transcription factor DYT1-like [Trifolium pratense]PNX71519.1 transcription factor DYSFUNCTIONAL TAPETUM 1 [Trifolium pratense]PNY01201.1 transcription factor DYSFUNCTIONAL TAPETUM 1 [Trifolium pratense]PNY17628.1 transcription factor DYSFUNCTIONAL TAPETUM 1 [Trifolium pratense]
MTKDSVITDAITYTKRLQYEVDTLTQELHALEEKENLEERAEPKIAEFSAAEDLNNWGIQEEVQVENIGENKLWIKIIIEKNTGRFMKLMETMNSLGIEIIEANVTTIKGAYLIVTSIKGISFDVHQAKHLLADIIKSI